jgi:hypothetical protein
LSPAVVAVAVHVNGIRKLTATDSLHPSNHKQVGKEFKLTCGHALAARALGLAHSRTGTRSRRRIRMARRA